ncbi:MAG TPA: hypothetical protein VFK86_06710 [Bauldia sp.]|nr:hypothetical protein [Bauldia sp.]
MADKSYRDFLDALGEREADGDYGAENIYGYLGKYQFGESALIDVGYYKADGTSANDWRDGFWTGKGGVYSKADFLASASAQEDAIRAYMEIMWGYLGETQRYAGQVIGGLKVTESGLLAGAHLRGASKMTAFLDGGAVSPPADAFGTTVVEYMTLFAGYRTPFTADHSGGETIAGGPKADALRGFGGDDTLRGSGGDDRIKGGSGADFIDGGEGSDRLRGGSGPDIYSFGNIPVPDQHDIVKGFRSGHDTIELDGQIFSALSDGPLGESMFRIGKAKDQDDHLLFSPSTGALRYDADGSGEGTAVTVAILDVRGLLTHADIVVA